MAVVHLELHFAPDYEAALSGAVIYPQTAAGCLRLSDQDRLDFLQRQTSNDLSQLTPGRAVVTVLTSPTGRILDVLTVFPEGDTLLALTLPGYGAATARHLQGKIFFMDNVSVSEASREFVQIDLTGVEPAGVLNALGLKPIRSDGETQTAVIGGAEVTAISQRGLFGPGYRLVAPADKGEALMRSLQSSGAIPLSEEVYQILRVEAGLPAAGHELTEEFTPLETGMEFAVSTTKGCYTGQEVIARQINYDKITRALVGLRLQGTALAGETVWAEGRAVGTITSFAHSPRYGHLALGIVRRPHNTPGAVLMVGLTPEGQPAEVMTLPFR